MSDVADRADAEIERELAEALRQRKPEGPKAVGVCHYCDAYLSEGKRWCDTDCEREWEYQQRRLKANGRNY